MLKLVTKSKIYNKMLQKVKVSGHPRDALFLLLLVTELMLLAWQAMHAHNTETEIQLTD
jgi:hypothetical protein